MNKQATYPKYPKYKDSGVEWLGKIPEGWKVKRLKFLGFIYAGLNGKKADDFEKEKLNGLKPFIPFTNIFNNLVINEKQFQYVKIKEKEYQNLVIKGDLLFLMSSETMEDIGKSAIYQGEIKELYLNSFCKGFRITNTNINHIFINYLLQSVTYRGYFNVTGRGFTRMNLKQEYVENLTIIIPPLPTQTAIAKFLDDKCEKIDAVISRKQRLIELLKERKQIIIQDAVTGKVVWNEATQSWTKPEKTKNSGVECLPAGQAGIGEIPEGWEVKKLGNMLKAYSVKNRPNENLLSITRELGVIERDIEDLESNHNFIPDDLSSYKLLRKGDFGMNKMKAWQGSFGVSGFTGIVSPAYFTFKIVDNVKPIFFHIAIRSKFYVPFFGQASDGVRIGQWDLSKDRMKKIPFAVPSIEEQANIVFFIETQSAKLDKAISQAEQQIEKLKEYKAVLIDSAVTGKIKVE